VSSLDAFPSANALIYYRIDFLIAHEGSKYTNLLRQQTDPDSGELYGNDVTPPARKKSPKPVPSREQQRHNVTERAWRRILRHQPHLSEAGARVRHSMITHTLTIKLMQKMIDTMKKSPCEQLVKNNPKNPHASSDFRSNVLAWPSKPPSSTHHPSAVWVYNSIQTLPLPAMLRKTTMKPS
jgi:hypothetical protein